MTERPISFPFGPQQHPASWIHWLRAGGQLGEWADNTIPEIQFASQVLQLDEGSVILNLGCGWGRHAIALAQAGFHVIGLDASAELLELARETCEQMGIQARWAQGELGDLELEAAVDAVVQFGGNMLEWVDGPAEALFLLDQVHAILKPNGRFLFGSRNWLATLPRHQQSRADMPERTELYHNTFDPDTGTVSMQAVVIGRDGSRHEYWRRAWHPNAEQMAALLYQAEFDIEGQVNDFHFLPYDPSQPGLVWLAQKT